MLSVRASDLQNWDIKTFTLRDLMPLLGNKYRTPSGVLQQLSRNLKKLEKLKIIHQFSIDKKDKKNPLISIKPNHEFFISNNRPTLHFLDRKNAEESKTKSLIPDFTEDKKTLIELLRAKRISLKMAKELVVSCSEEQIRSKIKLVEEIALGNKGIRSVSAFLVQAIRDDYASPLSPAEELAKQQKDKLDSQKAQIADIKRLISQNKCQEALELCRFIMNKQREITPFSNKIESLMREAENAANTESLNLELF